MCPNQLTSSPANNFIFKKIATNRPYTYPFATILVSFDSWRCQLFNDTKIVSNGCIQGRFMATIWFYEISKIKMFAGQDIRSFWHMKKRQTRKKEEHNFSIYEITAPFVKSLNSGHMYKKIARHIIDQKDFLWNGFHLVSKTFVLWWNPIALWDIINFKLNGWKIFINYIAFELNECIRILTIWNRIRDYWIIRDIHSARFIKMQSCTFHANLLSNHGCCSNQKWSTKWIKSWRILVILVLLKRWDSTKQKSSKSV